MHYYQFNIGDYYSHTQHLTPLEDIAYRRMIDWCYLHESPLPLDVASVCKIIRMKDNDEDVTYILEDFFLKTNKGWMQKRIQKEIKNYKTISTKRKQAANKRWQRAGVKKGDDASAMQVHSKCNAKQEPRTINQEPLTIKEEKILSDDSDGIVIDIAEVKKIPCPHHDILKLWDKAVPKELVRHLPTSWLSTRIEYHNLNKTWHKGFTMKRGDGAGLYSNQQGEVNLNTALDFWDRFFNHCSNSDFLINKMGRKFTLGWAVKPANFIKIIEGNYHNA